MSNECCLKPVYFIYFIETSSVIYLCLLPNYLPDTTSIANARIFLDEITIYLSLEATTG